MIHGTGNDDKTTAVNSDTSKSVKSTVYHIANIHKHVWTCGGKVHNDNTRERIMNEFYVHLLATLERYTVRYAKGTASEVRISDNTTDTRLQTRFTEQPHTRTSSVTVQRFFTAQVRETRFIFITILYLIIIYRISPTLPILFLWISKK
jgi:hypothetical protein